MIMANEDDERLAAMAEEDAAVYTMPRRVSPDRRVAVMIVASRFHDTVAATVSGLAAHWNIYQRGGKLVHVVSAPDPDGPGAYGAPVIRDVPVAILKSLVSEVVSFSKQSKAGGTQPCSPPIDVIGAVHAAGQWEAVRPLVGLLEAPSMRPDGSVLQEPGHDLATGYLLRPSADFGPIPDRPSQLDAVHALRELAEVFVDFPFASEAARMVPIAAVLTLLARPAIQGSVPLVAIDKTTRGTGGTLTVDAISMIARGRLAPKMSYPSMPEELEKILASYAISGAPIVPFDNVATAFGGPALDRCVTSGREVELRTLGRSEIQTLRWTAMVLASGNNMQLVGDTGRRSLVCRLETTLDNPEDRTGFRHPNLIAWVTEHRTRLVRAGLTLLRAWVVAGRPPIDGARSWGSFEAWAAIIPAAISFAGGANVLHARAEVVGVEDPDKDALRVVLESWPRLDPGGGITVSSAIKLLWPNDKAPEVPDGFDDLRDALAHLGGSSIQGRVDKIGKRFRSVKGTHIGGRWLQPTNQSELGRSKKWAVSQTGGMGGMGDG